uniref:Lipoprotein n=1 Tax=Tolypothrix bouteillei VB521301 TaxID=1479485 RepID=A0A0C1R7F5_9CYAN
MTTRPATLLATLLLAGLVLTLGGCNIVGGLAGGMAASYERTGTRVVEAEYTRLAGEEWAVIVSADLGIQGEYPDLTLYLTAQVTKRLAENNQTIAAKGYVPADRLLTHLYDNPRWVTKPRGELAKSLGVTRLVWIEVLDYRLNDPGNQYLWAGEASGTVSVIEADSPAPDEAAYSKSIRVRFPDSKGITQAELTREAVMTALAQRFVDRASWLLYTHEEPNAIKY